MNTPHEDTPKLDVHRDTVRKINR